MPLQRSTLSSVLLLVGCVSQDQPARDTVRAVAPSSATMPAAPADSSAADRARARWVVSPRGIGPVLAGMSITELATALGEPVKPSYAAGSRCAYVRPGALPRDVFVMVQNDTVARVDVRGRGVLTADGVGIGNAEASVASRYAGRVRTTPHKYTGPKGHYLTVSSSPDSTNLLLFETDGSTVVNYRAGRRSAVELTEGCS